MPILNFKGTIPQTLLSEVDIRTGRPNADPPTFCDDKSRKLPFTSFENDIITWEGDVPSALTNLTLKGLRLVPLAKVTTSTTVIITGNQMFDSSSFPTTFLGFNNPRPPNFLFNFVPVIYQPPTSSGTSGTAHYNVNNTLPNFEPESEYICVFNNGRSGRGV